MAAALAQSSTHQLGRRLAVQHAAARMNPKARLPGGPGAACREKAARVLGARVATVPSSVGGPPIIAGCNHSDLACWRSRNGGPCRAPEDWQRLPC